MKSLRSHFYGVFTFLFLLFTGLVIAGCDLFNNSMADYFLDNTEVVEVTGIGGRSKYAVMTNGTILIPPSDDVSVTILEAALSNPRSLAFRQELLGVPPGKRITARQAGSTKTEVVIEGAVLDDAFDLTLAMQSSDGLRDFTDYNMRIRCVSFNTGLSDFRVNEKHPLFEKDSFTVEFPYETTEVTLEGIALEPEADLALYQGQNAAGTRIASGSGKAFTAAPVAIDPGNNYFYLEVRMLGAVQGYAVNVIRMQDPNKRITEFYFTVNSKRYGVGPGAEAGSGSISGTAITVTVPYGTDVTALTASAVHTGSSISPDPAAERSYAAPVTYTVRAPDGTTAAYTVKVNAASPAGKALTAFNITDPVSAAGVINEAAKTVTVTVPYGTDVSALTASAVHTGSSISPDPATARSYAAPVTYTVTAADGSTAAYTVTVNVASSDAREITAFAILSPVSVAGTINGALKTITVDVPYETDITDMTAAITYNGASISPDPATARSYADPVTYTVTAADGSTAAYTVTVNVASSDAREITAFYFTVDSKHYGAGSGITPETGSGSIDETLKTITVTVPYGTDLTSLAPTVTVSPGASTDPAAGTVWGSSDSKTYTVTAEDGTSQTTYTVTVNVAQGITISGITVVGLNDLTFSGGPTMPVAAATSITVTIDGVVANPGTDWYVDINGPVSLTSQTSNSVGFNAPAVPGFYNINVFAIINGIPYSGYFELTVK